MHRILALFNFMLREIFTKVSLLLKATQNLTKAVTFHMYLKVC